MAQQQAEIGRLLQAVNTLGAENENLVKERDVGANRLREVLRFQRQFEERYQKRFALLKVAMEQFKRDQARAKAMGSDGGASPGRTAPEPSSAAAPAPNAAAAAAAEQTRARLLEAEARCDELRIKNRQLAHRVRDEAQKRGSAEALARKQKNYIRKLAANAIQRRNKQQGSADGGGVSGAGK